MCVNSCAGQTAGGADRWGCPGNGHSAAGSGGAPPVGGASGSAGASGSGSSASSSIQASIKQMQDAFDQAIQTNAEITSVKTTLGSIETVAQQRPNIG
jgi:hypothetical protein